MIIRDILLASAAASLAAAPVAANAADASLDRSSQPVAEKAELGGGSDFVRGLLVAAIAAIGMVVLIVSDDDDEDLPLSP